MIKFIRDFIRWRQDQRLLDMQCQLDEKDRLISVLKADLRQLQLEISGQEILTKDKAALRINFYTQYKVVDIIKALIENKEYEKQLYILMQLALR